jgi:hypothetical protein
LTGTWTQASDEVKGVFFEYIAFCSIVMVTARKRIPFACALNDGRHEAETVFKSY